MVELPNKRRSPLFKRGKRESDRPVSLRVSSLETFIGHSLPP
ncbi:MAG: hypothetical protein V7K71_15615 [Nostoc sp.]